MKTVLNIEGMSCSHCVKHTKEALEELSGVKSAQVSLEKKNAEVEHDASITLDTMKAAIEEVGFTVK